VDVTELGDQLAAAILVVTGFAGVAITARVFRHTSTAFFSWLNGILAGVMRRFRGA